MSPWRRRVPHREQDHSRNNLHYKPLKQFCVFSLKSYTNYWPGNNMKAKQEEAVKCESQAAPPSLQNKGSEDPLGTEFQHVSDTLKQRYTPMMGSFPVSKRGMQLCFGN
ncbi:hypothetical protein XELAEV_18031762mg [Xenopus laevis]|uniref:Uncharacterized protein n=1 Tax=Xenopus laevis TaxID=8355 RepID=A0A974CN56_XENLA|nr:hypothetical protein XELAEV_18031762mg [Xenopus laevis]